MTAACKRMPYQLSCDVPTLQRTLELTLPVQPSAQDAARWYLFVDHDVLEPTTPLGVAFTCDGASKPHLPNQGFPNLASLRVSVVTGIRFEHEAPSPDYQRAAKFIFHYVLQDGCLLDLNGDVTIEQTPADWREAP